MRTFKSVFSVILAAVLQFGTCGAAFAAEKDTAPVGLLIEPADDGITTVVTYDNGGTVTVDGVIDVEATEKNSVIERIDSFEVRYEDEPILTVEPRDIAATGSSAALGNGYYAISFPIPDTSRECYLTGLLPEKVDHIEELLLECYTEDDWFCIEDIDFIDAEKLLDVGGDDLMCWAGTASNMLHYSGWGRQAGFETEDDVFEAFIDAYEDEGHTSGSGINWFFNGVDITPEMVRPGTGAYLPQYDVNALLYESSFELYDRDGSVGIRGMNDMIDALRAGDAVGFDVAWVNGDSAHAITLWGCITDSRFDEDDPERYCNLILSDSDNSQPEGTDRRVAPNTMDFYPCYMLEGEDFPMFCIDYQGEPGALLGYTTLQPYSEEIPYETDERATLDPANDPDFFADGIGVSSYPEGTSASRSKAYEGDVYLFADIDNCGAQASEIPLTVAAEVKNAAGETVFTAKKEELYAPEIGSIFRFSLGKAEQLPAGSYTLDVSVNPDCTIQEALLFNNRFSSSFEVTGQKPNTSDISLSVTQGAYTQGVLELYLDYGDLENTELYKNSDDVELWCSRYNAGTWSEFFRVCGLSQNGELVEETGVTGDVQKVRYALYFYNDGLVTEYIGDEVELMMPNIAIIPAQPHPDEPLIIDPSFTGLAGGEQISFDIKNLSGDWIPAVSGSYEVFAVNAENYEELTLIPSTPITLKSGEESGRVDISPWGGGLEFEGRYYVRVRFTYEDYGSYSLVGQLCMIGAEEKGSSIVDLETDDVDPMDGKTSLREAVAFVEKNGGTVTFAKGVNDISLEEPIEIEKSVKLDGHTADSLGSPCIAKISGGMNSRIFTVTEGGCLELDSVVLMDGMEDVEGGAVLCDGGTLVTDRAFFVNCFSVERGGALCFNGGSGIIRNSGFNGMRSAQGAAIYMDNADVEILNTTISDMYILQNGAVYNSGGRLNIINSAITDCRADDWERSVDAVYSDGETNIINSIITDSYSAFRSASGSVSVYGSALYSAADEVITDSLTQYYENAELIYPTWLGDYPDMYYDGAHGRFYPQLTERALEGYFVSEQDGVLYLSKDHESFISTGVKTSFTDEELALDMIGRQRRAIYGPYNKLKGEYILGDADGDDEVEVTDAAMVQRYNVRALIYYSREELWHADVDGDGELTIIDVTWIQRYLAKMKVKYPISEIASNN